MKKPRQRYVCELYKTCERFGNFCETEHLEFDINHKYDCAIGAKQDDMTRQICLIDIEDLNTKGFDPNDIINKAFGVNNGKI